MEEAVLELREARERIDAVGWTQGTYARNSAGEPVDPSSPDAVCFCMYGAFLTKNVNRAYPMALRFLTIALKFKLPSPWQDEPGRKKEEVLAAFDRAIALAKAA